MAEFLFTVAVFAIVIAAMAVGVMAGRSPIKGSCGGMSAFGEKGACEICGGDTQRCQEQTGVSPRGVRNYDPDRAAGE